MLVDVKEEDKGISCMVENIPKSSNLLLSNNKLTLSSRHFIPYIDSSSWLYVDPNPIFRVATPAACTQYLEYAMPPPKRKIHRRRGPWNYLDNPSQTKQHRRGFSFSEYDNEMPPLVEQTSMIRTNEDKFCLPSEETSASTFRKVPWHPNLHMLKIRRT
ncbi:uncharacterized protein LOC122518431 [Polistes fuscatus]|uniref:uncharacterized protein LOC122518431 n=1 Tax=Polistes fuscatus TaxID=30207 RepID=UPI001CA9710C|nr:uncharacterized protein LOC122518431 [Polistes fuscatus]